MSTGQETVLGELHGSVHRGAVQINPENRPAGPQRPSISRNAGILSGCQENLMGRHGWTALPVFARDVFAARMHSSVNKRLFQRLLLLFAAERGKSTATV
jgi:hypothetical protein